MTARVEEPERREQAVDSGAGAWAGEDELGYLSFFGLEHNPFPVAPDAEHFYISPHINQVLTEIIHGLLTRKGFLVLTGDVGLGKTTLSRRLMSVLEKRGVETSLVFHTTYQDVELLREINRDFGLKNDQLVCGDQMRTLNDYLLEQNRLGRNCAIIIDDAQNLDHRSLELVRMISNLETDRKKLVQVLLVGQPELMDRLNTPELRQVRSRVMIKAEAKPLTLAELGDYLAFKLGSAGNRGQTTIEAKALKRIHRYCQGNFRRVNVLMDRCLCVAYVHGSLKITPRIVKEAYQDLDMAEPRRGRKGPALALAGLLWLILAALILTQSESIRWPRWSGPTPAAQAIAPSPTPAALPAQAVKPSPPPAAPPSKTAMPAPAPTAAADLTPVQTAASGTRAEPEPEPPAVSPPKTAKPAPASDPVAPRARPEPELPPAAVSEFLRSYQLAAYEKPFWSALRTWRFQDLAETIHQETGYRLIQLERLPEHLQGRYGLLAYPAPAGGKERLFLFWKPELTVNKFYYRYQGPEIRRLQELLAGLGLYNYGLDDIVGKNVMTAVNDFQARMGLPVTGFPDERTVFLLCHEVKSLR
ncbi:MAG: AAA family ATPase [Thermodesulfobacteriota bacterium]